MTVRASDEVAAALAGGRAVVALESTIIAHGLPWPDNLHVARDVEAIVRDHGAVPATIAVLGGELRAGLADAELERLASAGDVAKCGVRDLPVVVARGADGATTVAATAHIAHAAGIRAFATGGIGGVHRQARDSWDESADLVALGRTPICVVCAGVKSILDVGATLERLETLNVTVLGHRTDAFPGFYHSDSGFPVPWRVESAQEAAAVVAAGAAVGAAGAVLLTQGLPALEQVDPELHDRVLREGLAAAAEQGISGKAVTPFLLERFHRETGGESLRANIAQIKANAGLAADVAVALAS
jgi:pseudouridine-5'-phosphate glycosidase